jgi:uncharacterized membrane protein
VGAVLAHELVTRWRPGAGHWITSGVLPLLGVTAFVTIVSRALQARWRLTTNEVAQAVAVLAGVSLTVLTVIGVWFRGPGMSLVWPWAR